MALAAACVLASCWNARAVTVERLISREQREMEVAGRHLAVGRDGHVYVMTQGYVLRFNRDGTGKAGFRPSYAMWDVAVNADGVVAVACGHMDGSVRLWGPQLEERLVARGEFGDSDQLGWMAPCCVGTGPSGDFYAPDQHRGRIVRLDASGKKVKEYSLKATGENYVWYLIRMRVAEPLERFYVAGHVGDVHALGFDGRKLWTLKAGLGGQGQSWKDFAGDFDADDQGNVYVLRAMTDTIEVYDKDGKPSGKIPLEMGDLKGTWLTVRVSGDEIFIKRKHETELFQVYDRKSGKLRKVVHADAETVRMEYASAVWTAGQAMPFAVTIEAPAGKRVPSWPVRMARYNDSQWRSLRVVDGKVTVPADASGLYQIRVGYGEYTLDAAVEVRRPESRGTLSILTPLNRVYYGRGEEIPVTAIVRSADAKPFADLSLSLRDEQGGGEVLRLGPGALKWDGATARGVISKQATSALRPGRYLLTASVDGLTVAPQVLVIGPGLRERPVFNIVQGGDGAHPLVQGGLFDAPGEVAAGVARARRIGTNMFIDRLGGSVDVLAPPQGMDAIVGRLAKDPLGVAPEKAQVENLNRHAVAARGAFGMEQHAVLLHMDSVLPFLKDDEKNPGGWLSFWRLKDIQKMVRSASEALLPYAAFRGWSWACNWWYQDDWALKHIGVERKVWPELRKKVLDSGQWDPEVVRITNAWVSLIPEADQGLNTALQEAAPGKAHAVTGPYRQPGVIPPLSFATASEIDLFCQAEQLQMPFMTPHNVDFYKRPGKRAFGHPETANEDGSGAMIGAIVLGQAVRGADGTGWEGELSPWQHLRNGSGRSGENPRSTWQGHVSAYRALNSLLRRYGPWLTTLEPADHVAIVVSTRMMRLDWWDGHGHLGGTYFTRLFEAYNACLYAHRPASFVFAEDLKPGALSQYKALLVVGQRVELDPPLAAALAEARKAGVEVFHDGTCRPEHVQGIKPLGVAFDRVEKEPALMNDDLVYYRLPKQLKPQAEGLVKALGSLVPAVAAIANPEIMLTERRNGEGRFVWVLNNDLPDWEPWQMWRLGPYISNRVPQVVPVRLDAPDGVVYEVFAMKQVAREAVADLRTLPARLYALLPRPVQSLSLNAPDQLRAGDDLAWELAINGPKMSYPVRVRLLDADGSLLEETFPVATRGRFTVPVNAGPTVTLEAAELIAGKEARREVRVLGGIAARRQAIVSRPAALPVEKLFGPHLRDIAVSPDGSAALINAMSWNDNWYLLDAATGAVRSQGSVGHHYAYGPLAGGESFYVQGYDVQNPEGYHLCDLGRDGRPQRRFAAYGLPQRQKLWFGHLLVDFVNGFAVSPSGRWIASAGNLGLIVWSAGGKKLWSLDWWKAERRAMFLLAQGDETLITLSGMTVAAYRAATGQKLWELKLGDVGALQRGAASADGRTMAVCSDTWGGRVFVVRDGKLINTFYSLPDSVCLTPDGRHLAMNVRRELRWFAVDGGVEWAFMGDDWLHSVQLAPDGRKIAVSSDLGTLYVLDDRGRTLLERDFGASPVARWLGSDLLVATWMGEVIRLGADGSEKWRVRLEPKAPSRLQSAPAAEALPTVRPPWDSAADKSPSLADNLLAQVKAVVRMTDDRTPKHVYPIQMETLTDGKPDPPAKPWLEWITIGVAESGWCGKLVLEVESPRAQLSVDSITFVEDPVHPESWLRNLVMQVWDPVKKTWVDCPPLLSDAAAHTHRFDKPIVGSKFRFLGDKLLSNDPGFEKAGVGGIGWPVGNIRLGEIIFRGKALDLPAPLK